MTLEGIILRLQRVLEQRSSSPELCVVERKKVKEMHDALIKISRPSASSALDKAYSELVEIIEELVPDGGFYEKGKSINFTLEDVLKAYPKHKLRVLSVWNDGYMVEDSVDDLKRFGEAQWHLGKPLSEQSDELKSFLHTLLVPPTP